MKPENPAGGGLTLDGIQSPIANKMPASAAQRAAAKRHKAKRAAAKQGSSASADAAEAADAVVMIAEEKAAEQEQRRHEAAAAAEQAIMKEAAESEQRLLTLPEYDELGRGSFSTPAAACGDIPSEVALVLTGWALICKQQWQLVANRQSNLAVSKQMEQMSMKTLWTCGAAVINALQLTVDGCAAGPNMELAVDNLDLGLICENLDLKLGLQPGQNQVAYT